MTTENIDIEAEMDEEMETGATKRTMTKSYGSRNADKFVVRLPKGMRTRIAEVARNYHRSMNSEIVSRLENSLRYESCLQSGEAAVETPQETYIATQMPQVVRIELNAKEAAIIEHIRRLSPTKRDSLLELLSGIPS